jgi:hypothetical protein
MADAESNAFLLLFEDVRGSFNLMLIDPHPTRSTLVSSDLSFYVFIVVVVDMYLHSGSL